MTPEGLATLKRFEGFKAEAYRDIGGVWTVGYGTVSGVHEGMTVTEAEAERLLLADVAKAQVALSMVTVPLTIHQADALTSFIYNVGATAFRKSTLLKKLNAGDYDAVPGELMRWNKVKGKVVNGLTNRRAAEAGLWAKGSFVASNTVPAESTPSKAPAVAATALATATGAAQILTQFESIWNSVRSFGLNPHVLLGLAGAAVLAVVVWQVMEWRQR
jgi:lysozyme